MATRRTSAYFAAKFITGYVPTQADFEDLWASLAWRTEDNTMVNGAQFIDAANAGNLIQIGGGGTSNILIRSGNSQMATDDANGFSFQADALNNFSMPPGGGTNLNDESDFIITTPEARVDDGFFSVSTGDIKLPGAGTGLLLKNGSNNPTGTSALVGGTKTVSNTFIQAGATVLVIWTGTGTLTGQLKHTATVAGTSFTIASSVGTDTAQFHFVIFNAS